MAKYEVTSPDGRDAIILAPDGVSEEEVMAFAQESWEQWKDGGTYEMVAEADPEIPTLGMGKDVPDEENPMVRPGWGRPLDRAAFELDQKMNKGGATDWMNILSAAPPTASTNPTGMMVGAKALARKAGLPISEAPKAASQAAQVLSRGGKEGYRAPSSQVEGTSFLRRAAEMFGGGADVANTAAIGNQKVTNGLVKRALGIADNEPLTSGSIEAVRKNAGKAYEAVKALPGSMKPSPAFRRALKEHGDEIARMGAQVPGLEGVEKALKVVEAYQTSGPLRYPETVEAVRNLRAASSKLMAATDDPAKELLGRTYRKVANALDEQLEAYLLAGPHKNLGLAGKIKSARETIAKTHDVEDAFNTATGAVDAVKLSRGSDFLTGDLALVSDMAKTHGKAMRVPAGDVIPKMAPLDYVIGLGGATALGPAGLLLAGARPALKKMADMVAVAGGPHTRSGRRIVENMANLMRLYQKEAGDRGMPTDEDQTP